MHARFIGGWNIENKTEMKFENLDVKRDANGKVKRWYIKDVGIRNENWSFSPLLSEAAMLENGLKNRINTVTMVPYDCSKLRVTVFQKGI